MGGCPPATWDVFRLKHILREEKKEIGGDAPAGAISFGEVVFKDFNNDETLATYRSVRPGQFLINPLNLNYDLKSLRIALSAIECRVSPAYIVVSNEVEQTSAPYLRWALRVFDVQHIKTLGAGVRQTVTFEDIGECLIALPSKSDQDKIASRLDRTTASIEALVAKKTRFIELLREKRQALITHAVTKGLDEGVPIKDSGVEWLGEVPAAWRLPQIKFVARLGNGSTPARDNVAYWKDGHFPWLTSTCVNQTAIEAADEFVTNLALKECHLPIIEPPAVLVGITGQGKTRGMATTLHIRATINQHIVYLKPRLKAVCAEYLRYFMDSAYDALRFESDGAGSTKGAITLEQLANMRIPLPPIEEQLKILAHLNRATARIDILIAKTKRSIELLREHRTALITAAVTGKIDVRNAA